MSILVMATLLLASCSPATVEIDETPVVEEVVTSEKVAQVEEPKEEVVEEEVKLKPAEFKVTSLEIFPGPAITTGGNSWVQVEVSNTGEIEGKYEVVFKLDGEVIETKIVVLTAGKIEPVRFNLDISKLGIYVIDINGVSHRLWVKAPPLPPLPPSYLPPDETLKIPADTSKGFYWPYYLYIPGNSRVASQLGYKTYLLVRSNNSGFSYDDDQEVHDSKAKEQVGRDSKYARELRTPFLVPTFPRWRSYGHIKPQCLDRDVLLTEMDVLKRTDLQLIAMIDDATERLSLYGITLEKKFLMMGFSSAGMFTNRFAILHPEKIQAAAIGGAGGWPTVPIGEWNGEKLRYPIGVSDIEELTGEEFNIQAFQSIPQYFYIGDQDDTDAVQSRDDVGGLVFRFFGETGVERWPMAEEIYEAANCSSQFVLYPRVGHTQIPAMEVDIIEFFLIYMDYNY